MAASNQSEPEDILGELRAMQPVTTPAQAAQRRNLIQQLLSVVDPSTPFERAMLETLNEIVQDEPGTVTSLLRRQVRGQMDTTSLPIGQFGQAAETIGQNKTGTGFFETWAGQFAAEVEAAEPLAKGDPIVVVNPENNLVRKESNIGDIGLTDDTTIPRAGPQATINVANQEWVNGDPELEPSVSLASFSGDLTAGDEEVVARAESTIEEIPLDGVRVGVTAHKADIDNDASTPDESVVRYHFEYKNLEDVDELDNAEWTEFPWSPTVLPRGDLASPVPLLDDHVVGPLYGLRIRFENRTDEGSLVATSVAEEEMGGLIEARAVV